MSAPPVAALLAVSGGSDAFDGPVAEALRMLAHTLFHEVGGDGGECASRAGQQDPR
jgi:hypothetical protein